MTHAREKYTITPGIYITLIVAILCSLPGFYNGLTYGVLTPVTGVLFYGVAIFAAAFMLSWAAEVVQIDISESLAVAILALLAVLPEYAVDFVFTWNAYGTTPEAIESHHYAIANMTGANRLLVGLGWPFILFIYIYIKKKKEIVLAEIQRVELFYLLLASLYSITIPLKGELTLIDTVILVTLFGLYTRRAAQMETQEPEMVGPPKMIANMQDLPRRIATAVMFLFSGAVIFYVAHPFTESMIDLGEVYNIDKFLLVQWLAPIASESPEFIIAATWTLRGAANSAIKALISSKVNQWTLLIGTIPLVYAISGGVIEPFVLDNKQYQEILLTAAQSLFAVLIMMNLRFSKTEGYILLVLFLAQMIVESIRFEMMIVYLVLAAILVVMRRKDLLPAAKYALNIKKKS